MSFYEKLNAAIARNRSLLVVALDPNPEMMPRGDRADDPIAADKLVTSLKDWMAFVIGATSDRVCAYKPTLGFYQALGTAGLELLFQVLEMIPDSIPVILDAKHGDLNTSSVLAKTVFEEWQVDGITLNPYAGQDLVAPFLMYPDKAVFLLCRTSNPAAVVLQEYPEPESPFYLQLVEEAKAWGTPEQLGFEVGTTTADVLTMVRSIAPERTILTRSIWGGGDMDEILGEVLKGGLNATGEGLLIPVPQDLLASENLAAEVDLLNQKIDRIRDRVSQENARCELWMPDVCILEKHPHQDLILQLFDIGCILFGDYVQASGETFTHYIDLRKIISNPQVFDRVLQAYGEILQELKFDRIAGIPYGSLPTATGLSLRLERPMIFPRKEVKAHGTRRAIEGGFVPGETVVVVEDILITGNSAMEGAAKLKSAGLVVEDIVVLLDRGEEVRNYLKDNGYRAHSVLSIFEVADTLLKSGRITPKQAEALCHE
ncbi:bifunctional orotidine-5'-phosphate decarboxylase/orotate phosphoribosyltransferase [Oscillatoriales cyanobacterium LEGE 11467]|uniref:Orotate phosphoribosyltransferase n=1 Tax=Zarconia navalis LEGE 11467 TaxID=1828826 RepID=A0A928Z9T0_9CYAN|nr:bifunctional orotidine-5'-phosphate decarboxylase/orotate phosphoribosyltransferase [Zarconia navalis]MBE9041993.1 bifunctional orotidine-5'-phosphate decarboxylase/orotate phosphoribosyltransferase [Zarconia navalis LEGE 11467]